MINSTMNMVIAAAKEEQFKGDNTHQPCIKCNGRGVLPHYAHKQNGVCFTCNGTGKVAKKVTNKGGSKMKKNMNSIKFNLVEGEVVRQIKYTKDSMMVSRIATFSFLKVLDHEGLLPRGYLTRVKNGHISYHTCILMCRRKSQDSAYRLVTTKYGEYTLIGLVEKPTPQPEPTPEQLVKVIDLTEEDDVDTPCDDYGDEYQDDDADIPTNDENAMWAKVVAGMKSNR